MITRRTVLLYNLGLVLTLVVCGLLTTYVQRLLGQPPAIQAAQASAQAKAAKEILEDQDLEHLRSTASFYLMLSQDLKKARSEDNAESLDDLQYGCFLVAALFALGALLGYAATGRGEKPQAEPAP